MVMVGYPLLIIWSLISTFKRSRRGAQVVDPEWVSRVEGEDVNPNPQVPRKVLAQVDPIYRVTIFRFPVHPFFPHFAHARPQGRLSAAQNYHRWAIVRLPFIVSRIGLRYMRRSDGLMRKRCVILKCMLLSDSLDLD